MNWHSITHCSLHLLLGDMGLDVYFGRIVQQDPLHQYVRFSFVKVAEAQDGHRVGWRQREETNENGSNEECEEALNLPTVSKFEFLSAAWRIPRTSIATPSSSQCLASAGYQDVSLSSYLPE